MPIIRYTAEDFANRLSTSVQATDKTLDTRIGPFRDIFIDPFAETLENQNGRIIYVNDLMSLKNADRLIPEDVDALVYNENLIRWGANRSITTLTFSRITAPTSDIVVPVNFPVSTAADQNGVTVIFKTIEEKTMYAASASQYWNPDTGNYEISVSAASVSTGTNTVVGPYTITVFQRSFPQFQSVFNKDATTDGRGIETNSELAKRYLLHVSGSQIGTPNGLKKFIVDNFNAVSDCLVVYGDNVYMTRQDTDVGAVDVWVLAEISATRSYTTYYNGVYTLNSVDFQPLMSVDSVTSVAAGATYIEGTDYEVVTGEGIYGYSNRGSDGIRWLSGGSHPDIGDDITIVYKYNSVINILDSFFSTADYFHMSSDVLFRWAQPTYLEISANLKIRSGSPSTVLNNVKTAVMDYINDLQLGENVEEFDIDSAVSRVFGVDNWTYNQLSVKDGNGVSDIEIGPFTYPRILSSDFVINLV